MKYLNTFWYRSILVLLSQKMDLNDAHFFPSNLTHELLNVLCTLCLVECEQSYTHSTCSRPNVMINFSPDSLSLCTFNYTDDYDNFLIVLYLICHFNCLYMPMLWIMETNKLIMQMYLMLVGLVQLISNHSLRILRWKQKKWHFATRFFIKIQIKWT